MQAAAPRADRPVDGAQLIARHVPADVGILDARPDVSSQVGAEAVEQFGARGRGGLRWRQRKYEDVGGVRHADSLQKPAARNDIDASHDRIPAPPVGGDDHRLALVRDRLDVLESHAVNGVENEIHCRVAGFGVFADGPHAQSGCLRLEAPQRAWLGLHVDLRNAALPPDRHQHADQWGCEGNELPVAADQGDGERGRGACEDGAR
jgi:hypothetical protein